MRAFISSSNRSGSVRAVYWSASICLIFACRDSIWPLMLHQLLLILQSLLASNQSFGKKLIIDVDLFRGDLHLLAELLNFPLSIGLFTRQRLHLKLGALLAQEMIALPLRFRFLQGRASQADLLQHLWIRNLGDHLVGFHPVAQIDAMLVTSPEPEATTFRTVPARTMTPEPLTFVSIVPA